MFLVTYTEQILLCSDDTVLTVVSYNSHYITVWLVMGRKVVALQDWAMKKGHKQHDLSGHPFCHASRTTWHHKRHKGYGKLCNPHKKEKQERATGCLCFVMVWGNRKKYTNVGLEWIGAYGQSLVVSYPVNLPHEQVTQRSSLWLASTIELKSLFGSWSQFFIVNQLQNVLC